LIGVALLLAAVQPDPTTVNGDIIGKAKDFTTRGPAHVCMEDIMVTALPGESVSLDYAGIHEGSLRLNRGRSWTEIAVGEIFAQPSEIGEIVLRRDGYHIADLSTYADLSYGLFGPDKYNDQYHLRVWIDGPSLVGDVRDNGVLRRVEVRKDNSPRCDVTYHFGWDMLFGNEPLAERTKH
jgi:hypothetical protein